RNFIALPGLQQLPLPAARGEVSRKNSPRHCGARLVIQHTCGFHNGPGVISMQAMSRSISSPKSALAAGIGLMLLGCFVFSLNDALGKWLVATYSVGELLLIRSAAALWVL